MADLELKVALGDPKDYWGESIANAISMAVTAAVSTEVKNAVKARKATIEKVAVEIIEKAIKDMQGNTPELVSARVKELWEEASKPKTKKVK